MVDVALLHQVCKVSFEFFAFVSHHFSRTAETADDLTRKPVPDCDSLLVRYCCSFHPLASCLYSHDCVSVSDERLWQFSDKVNMPAMHEA